MNRWYRPTTGCVCVCVCVEGGGPASAIADGATYSSMVDQKLTLPVQAARGEMAHGGGSSHMRYHHWGIAILHTAFSSRGLLASFWPGTFRTETRYGWPPDVPR